MDCWSRLESYMEGLARKQGASYGGRQFSSWSGSHVCECPKLKYCRLLHGFSQHFEGCGENKGHSHFPWQTASSSSSHSQASGSATKAAVAGQDGGCVQAMQACRQGHAGHRPSLKFFWCWRVRIKRTSRSCYKLGRWVSSLSPRVRAQAGHFCPAYASRNPP